MPLPVAAAVGALVAAALSWPTAEPVTLRERAPVSAATTAPLRPPLPAVGPFRSTARDDVRATVSPVTVARLSVSHRAGCPVAVADLRLVAVTHWDLADAVVAVFRSLHAARFPSARVVTAEQYGADDDALMAANATSGYNCRQVTGGTTFSEQAFGRALDLDPEQNPYVRGTTVEPPAGPAYLDRDDVRPGMIVGGDVRTLKDYTHFSQSGR